MAKADSSATLLPPNAAGPSAKGAVECLGLSFESEDTRRAHFLERLKEQLPELRQRHDFPIGEDEDILRLSDPPYYTACPNPFLAEFVAHYGKPYDPDEPYHREPFAVDVSVGKTDPLYKAHGYHTKVPHRAIVPSILHYTEPGDIVLDGFCGSGMTGVAAQWCGTAPPEYRMKLEQQWAKEGREPPKWGARRAILGDLSPAATFIAANYNIPFDVDAFAEAAQKLLDEVEEEIGWMYETLHTDGKNKGRINYTVWSEVFTCPECAGDIVFVDETLDQATGKTRREFPCPHCMASLNKKRLDRSFETIDDLVSGSPTKRIRMRPLYINYTMANSRYEKKPDASDLATIKRISGLRLPAEFPTNAFPIAKMYHGSRLAPKGLTHIRSLFVRRAALALSSLWFRAVKNKNSRIRSALLFFFDQAIWNLTVLNTYRPTGFSQNQQWFKGVYYAPSQHSECSPWYVLSNKLYRYRKVFCQFQASADGIATSTGDCGHPDAPDQSIDYIFTDPPFGENIYYADLNYIVESFYGILTNTRVEAIVDSKKGKLLHEYQLLMQKCFEEYFRVLKPGRWITVVFHNSRNAVWNAIQEGLLQAGFIVADVRTLDKKQGSFRQVTSTAVKQDLVISAYKPNGGLEERFKLKSGSQEGAWDFIRAHLLRLPVAVTRDNEIQVSGERQKFLLFDRMVAFHVLRGAIVPFSAAEFYAGLSQRFAQRDQMYFLPEQVVEYDRKRATTKGVIQLELFVKDEETAIQWLRQQLDAKPQTYQDIHPNYIRELAGWAKHEKMLELATLLRENFLHYNGQGEVPPQLHTYLSTNYKDLRNLPKDAPALRTKAKDRWYVPDPHKAGDLEKLRDRTLLREFAEYQASDLRRLRVFRLEAIRAGFRRAWQASDYATIVTVAQKIPEGILQEDPKLMMWYDQATVRQSAGR